MADDSSRLSEFYAFLRENNTVKYMTTQDLQFNDKMLVTFSEEQMSPHGNIEGGYPISDTALKELAKIIGIPTGFLKKVPKALASYNLNYLCKYDSRRISVEFSESEDEPPTISEITQPDIQYSVLDVVNVLTNAFDGYRIDPYIIQTEIDNRSVSLVALKPEPEETLLGNLHRGIAISVSLDKNPTPYAAPVLGDLYEETITVFNNLLDGHTPKFDFDSKEVALDALSSLIMSAIEKMDDIDDYLAERRDHKLTDIRHIAYSIADRCDISVPTQKKVYQALLNMQNESDGPLSVINASKAVTSVEDLVKGVRQAFRLGALAGDLFDETDPDYCPTCHQEIDEEGNHLPQAELSE